MFCADYLLRAFEANPYDPLVALLLAQAYFGRAMNRQSDNRHHQIITVRFSSIPHARIQVGLVRKFIRWAWLKQGVAFMRRYEVLQRQVSQRRGSTIGETEYNIARAYHGLGELSVSVSV
jgi:general transcription factor 3C polypeptide 3 (transcription factor C subunit 4)